MDTWKDDLVLEKGSWCIEMLESDFPQKIFVRISEHGTFFVEHQSVDFQKPSFWRLWNGSQLEFSIFGCSIWRRKGCKASFGWVFGIQLGLRQRAVLTTRFTTFSPSDGTPKYLKFQLTAVPQTPKWRFLKINWLMFHEKRTMLGNPNEIFFRKSDSKISIHHDPFSRTPKRVWFLLKCYNFGRVMTFW